MNEPLLDLRVYKYPMFALASVIAIVNAVAMFSGMILTPAYVQNVRGISPLSSGLMMLPGAVIMGLCHQLQVNYLINMALGCLV